MRIRWISSLGRTGGAGVLLIVLLTLAACSTFPRQWRGQVDEPLSAAIVGRWEGTWESDVNRHRGRLRGMITQVDAETYAARFQATFWKIFRGSYRVVLTGTEQPDGTVRFWGEADLGWWGGGVFRCEGTAGAGRFEARYWSERDRGVFAMRRPGADGCLVVSRVAAGQAGRTLVSPWAGWADRQAGGGAGRLVGIGLDVRAWTFWNSREFHVR
jgi:hypothetical protein